MKFALNQLSTNILKIKRHELIKIGIIGGGFTGTMTAVQLINHLVKPCEITLISELESLNKGIAFNPYSKEHLLNVVAGKMSAFPDKPDHFLDWILQFSACKFEDKTILANSFLPRRYYGEYLRSIWENTRTIASEKQIKLNFVDSQVSGLSLNESKVKLKLNNGQELVFDYAIIATGNQIPRNPKIQNTDFFQSENYFQNPWKIEAVSNTVNDKPILIIGNGLTMVDTVIGLRENGFNNEIISVSPNGFNILPHRHSGITYTKLVEDLNSDLSLLNLVSLFNKHIKAVRKYGISAEPIVDSLRPLSQHIWKSLPIREKQIFLSRIRHLWGVARHRIPMHTHDMIQGLRIEGKLQIKSGKIIDLKETKDGVCLSYYDNKDNLAKSITVSRVINCTGPDTDIMNLDSSFLRTCMLEGLIKQDELKLGISTDISTYRVIKANGIPNSKLFTLGSNLRGELWETTAVNELRVQAVELAKKLKIEIENLSMAC